jgi:nucleotide-binding universal stress UspA family protein
VQAFLNKEMSAMAGIVVGIDGSHHSTRALDWAIKEAALRQTPLTVLSVHQVIRGWTGPYAGPYPHDQELVQQTKAAAQEATDKALAALEGARPEVNVVAVNGIPAEALLAASADADMIVVGSRGAGGFERLTMGSVGDQVARHAHCPVVIVPHAKKG